MPENAVRKAFGNCFGSKPLVLYNLKSAFYGPVGFDPTVETWPKIAGVVKEAGGFSNVSKQTMIIRLQGLGLGHPVDHRIYIHSCAHGGKYRDIARFQPVTIKFAPPYQVEHHRQGGHGTVSRPGYRHGHDAGWNVLNFI